MDNKQGYAEAYKDVIHEDAIKIGGETKAPDYCFRIGGARNSLSKQKSPQSTSRKSQSRLSTEAVCLVRKAALKHPDGFRGICGLRLPHKTGPD